MGGKSCLILGGAGCVWEDAAAALDLFQPDLVLAVNDIGAHWARPLDCWISLHPEKLGDWVAQRKRRLFAPAAKLVAHKKMKGIDEVVDYHFPGMKASGSSGLFAVKVAIDRGAQRIVLAGVPMTKADGHFFNPEPWRQRSSYTQAWEDMLPMLRQYVRSMSGWTAEKLGKPSKEWISE